MSEQHTPGPWTVVDATDTSNDEYWGTPIRVLQGQRQWIHAIGQPWVPERLAVMDGASDADERVMAAAPDLLAALWALYQWTTDHVDSDSDVLGALEDRARALLARVDGSEGSGPVPVVPVRTVQVEGPSAICPECKGYLGHTAICSQGRD